MSSTELIAVIMMLYMYAKSNVYLKMRINDHKNHINRNITQYSVIEHRVKFGCEFDWKHIKILETKRKY